MRYEGTPAAAPPSQLGTQSLDPQTSQYYRSRTGLLLVDPYNDFVASEGKLCPFAKEMAEAVNHLSHFEPLLMRHAKQAFK